MKISKKISFRPVDKPLSTANHCPAWRFASSLRAIWTRLRRFPRYFDLTTSSFGYVLHPFPIGYYFELFFVYSRLRVRKSTLLSWDQIEQMSVVSHTSRFAYRSIRLHRGRFECTTKSFRLHAKRSWRNLIRSSDRKLTWISESTNLAR